VVVNRQLNDRPPRPSEIRPDLTDFDAIFARALSQDPVDRFRRCRDFAKALESTGGTRSHIRATSEVRAASIFREASGNGDSAPTAFVATPRADDPTPTESVPEPAPETTKPAAVAASNGLPDKHVDDVATTVAPVVTEENDDDDESAEARKRRLQQSAAIAGVIAVVLLAWFMGVKALRSASRPDDAPANVETTSVEPNTPTPVVIAPPPVLPVAPPPPVATTAAPTTTVPTTTAKRPTTTTPAQSTAPATTASKPPKSATTTTPSGPNVLDTRPAVGMPCGAEGSAAVSNSGGPVTCVSTPGGFAWEPPGG
jgi:serine/threonine-protein kinase